MGGAASSTFPGTAVRKLKKSEEEIVLFMRPVYYIDEVITREEIQAATATWELILHEQAPEFLRRRKEEEKFPYRSCVIFFYDSYYTRLFDIHPACRPLFKSGMKAQGRFLVKMISFSLSEFENPERFEQALIKLTEVHYHRGVRAVEYSIVGEVLLWTLKFVLGTSVYTPAIHKIWVKVYCRMLKTILPVAIAMEVQQIPFQNPDNNPALRTGATFTETDKLLLTRSNTQDLNCENLRTVSSL